MVQWLGLHVPNAGGQVSIPGKGTRPHKSQLRICIPKLKNAITNTEDPMCHNQDLAFLIFILLYNTVLLLPYIDMNQPRVYMSSQSWTPLPPCTPYHLSGSSPCTSPKHPVSCIKHRLAIRFLPDSIHVSMPFSQIIPPSPSLSESKSPFYTSVSLAVSHRGLSLPSF